MRIVINMTGQRFGKLKVLREAARNNGVIWLCQCDCGNECQAKAGHLRSGSIVSCGCHNKLLRAAYVAKGKAQTAEERSEARRGHRGHLVHGHSADGVLSSGYTPEYSSWQSMRQRCLNPNRPDYHLWGGRGITICERWSDYRNFYADMGPRPAGKTLERENVDGNYEPGNCSWATPKQQRANQRRMK